LAACGARIVKAPQNYDYGMRDFDLIDLDGSQLTFGMGRQRIDAGGNCDQHVVGEGHAHEVR
jgi:hypothetical protein